MRVVLVIASVVLVLTTACSSGVETIDLTIEKDKCIAYSLTSLPVEMDVSFPGGVPTAGLESLIMGWVGLAGFEATAYEYEGPGHLIVDVSCAAHNDVLACHVNVEFVASVMSERFDLAVGSVSSLNIGPFEEMLPRVRETTREHIGLTLRSVLSQRGKVCGSG